MFDLRATAEEHKVRSGETLESLASGIGTTWQKLAEFNWGTRDPVQINDHLAEDVGCTRRDPRGNYIFDDADDPGTILLPQWFRREGLAARQVHTIFVREPIHEDRLIDCFGIPGATFRFGRSFIRPSSMELISMILDRAEEFDDATLCVFGHTDSADDPRDNKRLSERRAWALWAVLVHDPDAWITLCDHARERWDEREFRRIHESLGSGLSARPTRDDFDAYLGVLRADRPPIPKSRFLKNGTVDGFMGCGEFNHLIENVQPHSDPRNQALNERNRRVVVFFFRGGREPTLPCKHNDIAPCQRNGAQEDARSRDGSLFSCTVYDRIGRTCDCEYGLLDGEATFDLLYVVHDPRGKPITHHKYELTLSDGGKREGSTDAAGLVVELDVPPGEASIKLDGYSHIDEDLTDNDVPSQWGEETETPDEGEDVCGA